MSQPNSRAEGAIPTVIKIEDGQDLLEALQDREKKKRLAEMERHQGLQEPEQPSFLLQDQGKQQHRLARQLLLPQLPCKAGNAISFAKYWKHFGIGLGPQHYPMLKDKMNELRIFRGEKEMTYREWEKLDNWFFRACQQSTEEDTGTVGKDKSDRTKDTNTTTQTNANGNLDEMEVEAENRVKKITEKLQKAKEDLRKAQKRKRDHYKSEAEFWVKSSEVFKQKAARDTQKADSEKSQAEWNGMMAKMYAEQLGRSPSTAIATPSTGERRPGDGHLDKRQRTTSEENRPLLAKRKPQW
ncbi:hypothetical protein FAGAP_2278 [Fusarium agapanthi]|uniref:Uncharacterized protein n=1 Tax=Fusarium agapanthi TaxID=1803897 RepID=A0A9P5BHP2_9HYPO|nr:hypothetical protein FAGAP_2278 [Fusarium agapanthi]